MSSFEDFPLPSGYADFPSHREMLAYCGQTLRVKARVNHIIDESSGRMLNIRRDAIILEGAVCSGEVEIFLCEGGQGGRGRGPHKVTFGPDGDQTGDKGVWISIWVDDVDAIYRHCLAQGLEVTWPPTDHPWNVREMHVRHQDGHVFRIGKSLEEE